MLNAGLPPSDKTVHNKYHVVTFFRHVEYMDMSLKYTTTITQGVYKTQLNL